MSPDAERISQYGIRAVDRVCDILDAIQEAEGRGSASDIAARARLPKSTAMRYLLTLESRGYVAKNELDGSYVVGMGLQMDRRDYFERVRDVARPVLEHLRAQFGETANLCIGASDEVLYLAIAPSLQPVRYIFNEGMRFPLHATASGKVIAAQMSARRLDEVVSGKPLARFTDATIVDVDQFRAQVEAAAANGFATDDGECTLDGTCFAVPVVGAPVAMAVSMSAPSWRLTETSGPEMIASLRQAAQELTGLIRAII
ncbi:IclR family transcriptional regulator [Microbacterium sp. 2MCAF23]|uniref:IclR family transcriptional regulator n=1 Tax=Microbacterium sp. 2MCAF23 TaxID=3232985 RepID=UPI003F9695C6